MLLIKFVANNIGDNDMMMMMMMMTTTYDRSKVKMSIMTKIMKCCLRYHSACS
jgi:hypothetical protein